MRPAYRADGSPRRSQGYHQQQYPQQGYNQQQGYGQQHGYGQQQAAEPPEVAKANSLQLKPTTVNPLDNMFGKKSGDVAYTRPNHGPLHQYLALMPATLTPRDSRSL